MSRTGKLGAGERMLLGGYGPLVALLATFALITALAPTIAPERVVTVSRDGSMIATEGGPQPLTEGVTGGAAGPAGTATVGPATGGAGARPCTDRDHQVPGDPYSPPCIAWDGGENGGATTRGVTEDTILLAYRLTTDPSLQDAVASAGGGDSLDATETIERTAYGLVDYFNSRFQFYGRKLQLVPFQGRGQLTVELLGGGQDAANNDAIKVATEVGSFADISALSQPYSDALSRQRMLAFGAPYMSREWFAQRRPYAWALAPDCSTISELVADYANKRVFGRSADHAGGDMRGRPRNVALIAPDNPEYQQCIDHATGIIGRAGNQLGVRESYALDIASMSSQAASLVAKLRASGATTVVCWCDPILPIFLTAKAQEQSWQPEWLVTGVALTDVDVVGQLYEQRQWSRAFGISALGDLEPLRGSLGYQAYKSVRNDEPALIVDILYYTFYMLAIGVQMAGPHLTPETFEQGMFAYPGGSGIAGRWKFGPNNYTPMEDGREIWWDPNAISIQNGQPGAYRSNPQRYDPGRWPAGEPEVFR